MTHGECCRACEASLVRSRLQRDFLLVAVDCPAAATKHVALVSARLTLNVGQGLALLASNDPRVDGDAS